MKNPLSHGTLLSSAILSILAGCLTFLTVAMGGEHPNVVFILADDMSYDSVSYFNPEIGGMQTPHIDRMAREGMYFTDGHSGSSVCTPTRYGLLTGRYAWRTQLKNSVLWTYGRPLIDKERLTVADMLKEKGYQTAIIGKWHLGMDWPGKDGQLANQHVRIKDTAWGKDMEARQRISNCEEQIDFTMPIGGPLEHGFEYYYGVDLPNMAPYTWIENDRVLAIPTVPKPDPEIMFGNAGLMVPDWRLEDILPGLANKSAEWIAQAAKMDKPFFLYVPLTSPHSPVAPSKRFQGKSGINKYVDFVMETDWAVGQIGFLENYVIPLALRCEVIYGNDVSSLNLMRNAMTNMDRWGADGELITALFVASYENGEAESDVLKKCLSIGGQSHEQC